MPRPSWAQPPAPTSVNYAKSLDDLSDNARAENMTDYVRPHPMARTRIQFTGSQLTVGIYNTETGTDAQIAAYVPSTGVWTSVAAGGTGARSVTLDVNGSGSREVWVVHAVERYNSGTGGVYGTYITSIAAADGALTRLPTEVNDGWTVVSSGYGGLALSHDVATSYARLTTSLYDSWKATGIAASDVRVLLQASRNDAAAQVAAATFQTQYGDLVSAIRAVSSSFKIYCQTPIPQTTETWGSVTLTQYRTAINDVVTAANSANVVVIDGTAIMATSDLFDGVHPKNGTADGNGKYATNLLSQMSLTNASHGLLWVWHDSMLATVQTGITQELCAIGRMKLALHA